MAINTTEFARRAPVVSARIVADRRRHKRIPLALLGRFMRANKQEYPCKLQDVSVGGAAMHSPVPVTKNERIVAYFDQIGGIEGTVVRVFDGGFAIKLTATQHKREKLAAQLTYLANRASLPIAAQRREGHDRVALRNTQSTLKLAEGITVPVQVLDISISGASVTTEARPHIGQEVVLGKLRARIVRHHETGIGVQFLDIQNPVALRRSFG